MSLLNQCLLLLWVFTGLVGIHISTQKLTYDITVLNIPQSAHSKQPLRVSVGRCSPGFDGFGCCIDGFEFWDEEQHCVV